MNKCYYLFMFLSCTSALFGGRDPLKKFFSIKNEQDIDIFVQKKQLKVNLTKSAYIESYFKKGDEPNLFAKLVFYKNGKKFFIREKICSIKKPGEYVIKGRPVLNGYYADVMRKNRNKGLEAFAIYDLNSSCLRHSYLEKLSYTTLIKHKK